MDTEIRGRTQVRDRGNTEMEWESSRKGQKEHRGSRKSQGRDCMGCRAKGRVLFAGGRAIKRAKGGKQRKAGTGKGKDLDQEAEERGERESADIKQMKVGKERVDK